MTTPRKSKVVRQEAQRTAEKLREIQELLQAAESEEKQLVDKLEEKIKTLAAENNLFCGVILQKQDMLNVLDLALSTGETVKIPFKLYYND